MAGECDVDVYYAPYISSHLVSSSSLSANVSSDLLHTLTKGHTVIPYTSTALDTWDALSILDRDPANESNVRLIYSDRSEPIKTHGVPSGWNREHLWPKSFGVGYSGADTSDLHALRSADWGVNSARSNLYFGACSALEEDSCVSPAHAEAAPTTSKSSTRFLPPEDSRGDIARSLFYMSVRYNGDADDENCETLRLGDSPCEYSNRLGILSELLQWHVEDPPSPSEQLRNNLTCALFQRNRNPFVDFPHLALAIWPEEADNDTSCVAPSPSPTPPLVNATTVSSWLPDPGAVAVIGFTSDNPDSIQFVVLKGIPAGGEFSVTDNGWDGEGLRTTEGTATFSTPSEVAAGTVLEWPSPDDSRWSDSGPALSASGDQLLVYSGTENFLFAVTFNSDGWSDPSVSSIGAAESVLPDGLVDGFTALALPHKDNYVWTANGASAVTATADAILSAIADVGAWVGSNSLPLSEASPTDWTVLPLCGPGFYLGEAVGGDGPACVSCGGNRYKASDGNEEVMCLDCGQWLVDSTHESCLCGDEESGAVFNTTSGNCQGTTAAPSCASPPLPGDTDVGVREGASILSSPLAVLATVAGGVFLLATAFVFIGSVCARRHKRRRRDVDSSGRQQWSEMTVSVGTAREGSLV